MADVLKTVTDRFCLYSNARKGRQNGRQYVLSAVKAMLESKETQEGLRLGELFGYYGHGRRQLTGKLEVPETSVIMVEGRPVVIDNVPACRTVAISVDDNGIVTHTQEILNTEPGKIVAAMIESRAGGWSWATGGRESGKIAVTTSFHG
ncbi:head processing protein, partial [Escherichia coli]|nr:head processing protein [Escherichia coli]